MLWKLTRTWRVDEAALAEACRLLQLEHPVTVTSGTLVVPGDGPLADHMCVGSYQSTEPPHHIILNVEAHPSHLSDTLLHELRHAQQRERGVEVPHSHDFDTEAAYHSNRWEEEARAFARDLTDLKLVRPALAFAWTAAWTASAAR